MSDDKSRKEFILKHMNADHQKSLSLYLRVYCQISARAAQSPTLEDLRLTDMVISAQGTRYMVPFSPPMTSISETRARVVAMHNECLERLGLSDITIQEYRAPQGAQVIGFLACLAALASFSFRSNFLPGSFLYETVGLGRVPAFAEFLYKFQPLVLTLLMGSHLFESLVLMAGKRLRKHGVPVLSRVWVAWILSNFIEGFTALQRFDGLVGEKRREKEQHVKGK